VGSLALITAGIWRLGHSAGFREGRRTLPGDLLVPLAAHRIHCEGLTEEEFWDEFRSGMGSLSTAVFRRHLKEVALVPAGRAAEEGGPSDFPKPARST
jgi:hypothetical protein